MSHVTRCPACATMFRVVDDQLKVAQGWVRCGHCGDVFEASLYLLAAGAGRTQASGGHRGADHVALPPSFPSGHAAGPPSDATGLPEGLAPALPRALDDKDQGHEAEAQSLRQAEDSAGQDFPDVPAPAEKPAVHAPAAAHGAVAASAEIAGRQEPVFSAYGLDFRSSDAMPQDTGPELQPFAEQQEAQAFSEMAFLREARRKDFWKSPLVRVVLGMVCLVLALALMLQWAVRQRDFLAAHAPRLAPWIQAICRPLGCEVRPLRRIESLVIENSSFSRTGPDAYRLNFTFLNTGGVVLEIPALEVTLTNSQDQAIVRRVVTPAEFGATAPTIAAYSRLAGALTLKVAGTGGQGEASPTQAGVLPVAGYRILAFYP